MIGSAAAGGAHILMCLGSHHTTAAAQRTLFNSIRFIRLSSTVPTAEDRPPAAAPRTCHKA